MTTLDNPAPINESTVPFFPTALKFGLYGGVGVIIYTLIANISGLSIPTSIMKSAMGGVMALIIYILIGVFAIRAHRNGDLDGNISFGRAFLVSLIAMVIAGVLGALFNVLYITVIDPGFIDAVVNGMEEMFESLGVDSSMAETQLEEIKDRFSPTTQLTTGILYGSLFGAVLSVILAAIMKKSPPVV